jgi:hypothetical protein
VQEQPPLCPQCAEPMEHGHIVDHGYGAIYPIAWVAGAVEWSRWVGMKLKGKTKMPVTTFRCPRCGRLDSFARPGKWPA